MQSNVPEDPDLLWEFLAEPVPDDLVTLQVKIPAVGLVDKDMCAIR